MLKMGKPTSHAVLVRLLVLTLRIFVELFFYLVLGLHSAFLFIFGVLVPA